jgi:hypothetical protein
MTNIKVTAPITPSKEASSLTALAMAKMGPA